MWRLSSKKIILLLFSLISCSLIQSSREVSSTKNDRTKYYEDLDQFRYTLENYHSYFQISDINLDNEIAIIRNRIEKSSNYGHEDFALDLQMVLGKMIDGHAEIEDWYFRKREKYLPFIIETVKDETSSRYKFLAIKPDRMDFTHSDYRYITHLNNIKIETWVSKLKNYIPNGTYEFETHRALRLLRYFGLMYELVTNRELDESKVVGTFQNSEGLTKTTEIQLSTFKPYYGQWPKNESRVLDGNIGYLAISEMYGDKESLRRIHNFMHDFKSTRGLIVDLRGNSGGRRHLVSELLPYMMKNDEAYYVATLGVCRLFDECQLSSRFMYEKKSKVYNSSELKFIENFESQFKPKQRFSEGKFSNWHYHLVRNHRTPQYFYNKPIIVLMNKDCFSATDIFLSALGGRANVKTIGESSSGGSAASRVYKLKNTRLKVRLARMLSFNRSGTLFDDVGISPDIEVSHDSTYYLVNGADRVLDRAITILTR